jgi:DNA-binding transcriptional LysR family regulator
MPINFRQIEAFRAVVESGTVSRAAERLSISQPAVSRLLRGLEHASGLTLFDRTKRRLAPTKEAMMLFDEVDRLFKGINDLAHFVEDVRKLRRSSLRIGVMPALSVGFIQDVLAQFVSSYPQTQLTIHARSTVKLVEWLVAGHLDIALTAHSVANPELTQISLCVSNYVCILPLEHPMAKKRSIRPQDLASEQFISFSSDSEYRVLIDRIFADTKVERKLFLEAPMAPTICALVAKGLGVSIINPFYIGAFQSLLAVRPFRSAIEGNISILLSRHRQRTLAADAFIACAQSCVQSFDKTDGSAA